MKITKPKIHLYGLLIFWISSSCSKTIIPENNSQVEQTVTAFLNCTECENGELNALKSMGNKVYNYLENIALYGAPAYLQSYTYLNYQVLSLKLVNWSNENNVSLPILDPDQEKERVNSIYRSRAIYALGELGGKRSLNVLQKLRRKIANAVFLDQINMALTKIQLRSESPNNELGKNYVSPNNYNKNE